MLDFLDSFQLGTNSRNNSLHLGRDSFSSVLGNRSSINVGRMDTGSLARGSISVGSSRGSVSAGNSNSGATKGRGGSGDRRRSRRLSGGSASILSELAEAAKA